MPNATTAAGWDDEYRAGRWSFLRNLEEAGRTGIISAWLRGTGTGARVLDIGCGEGVLFHHLDRAALRAYVGVDLSGVALEKAEVDPAVSRLVEADLASFAPESGETFSAIVFNEVLHFAESPGAELKRYARHLEPGGVIAVSMYAPWKEDGGGYAKVRAMEEATDGGDWERLDALDLTSTQKNVRWRLRLVRPKG